MLAAQPHDLAGHQHQLAAEHVVGGHAVFEAVHAAGVLGDVAADGAGDLRGRIGGVVEAGVLDGLCDREIGHARLRHHHAVVEIDVADAAELGHAEQHPVNERKRAARERGAGAARHHLDALAMAVREHARDLLGGLRQHHHHRERPVGGEPVGFVRAHLALGRDHALARHDGAERRHDGVAAVEHGPVGLRHCDGHGFPPSRPLYRQKRCAIALVPAKKRCRMPAVAMNSTVRRLTVRAVAANDPNRNGGPKRGLVIEPRRGPRSE